MRASCQGLNCPYECSRTAYCEVWDGNGRVGWRESINSTRCACSSRRVYWEAKWRFWQKQPNQTACFQFLGERGLNGNDSWHVKFGMYMYGSCELMYTGKVSQYVVDVDSGQQCFTWWSSQTWRYGHIGSRNSFAGWFVVSKMVFEDWGKAWLLPLM